MVSRGDERCVVDLVIDRVPAVDPVKAIRGAIRIDTLRELAANKVCTVLGRSQIKDLIDLQQLLSSGTDLVQAIADAAQKDKGVDPATLAWVLQQLTISPEARLPGGTDAVALEQFRLRLIDELQRMAFERTR